MTLELYLHNSGLLDYWHHNHSQHFYLHSRRPNNKSTNYYKAIPQEKICFWLNSALHSVNKHQTQSYNNWNIIWIKNLSSHLELLVNRELLLAQRKIWCAGQLD